MASPLNPRYVPDRVIQRKLMAQAEQEALKVLPSLKGLSRDEAAGVIRTATIGLVDRYRSVAEVAATERYTKLRLKEIPSARQISLVANGTLPEKAIDDVVGAVMARFVEENVEIAEKVFSNKIGTRSVDLYRESIMSLARQDSMTAEAVRVASASACIYCQSESETVVTSYADAAYALEGDEAFFHDNCTCIIEVRF